MQVDCRTGLENRGDRTIRISVYASYPLKHEGVVYIEADISAGSCGEDNNCDIDVTTPTCPVPCEGESTTGRSPILRWGRKARR